MNGCVYNKTNEKLRKELRTLKKLLKFLMKEKNLDKAEANVILINSNEMHLLNKEYRNIDKTTDVLSFALEENQDFVDPSNRVLGDIYISLDNAKEQCANFENNLLEELKFLTIHGFLHLLRYDHIKTKDHKEMFDIQEQLLNKFNNK